VARTSTVLDTLQIATMEYYQQVVRVINEDNYINKRLLKKSQGVGGGEFILAPLEYGSIDVTTMGEYDQITLQPTELIDYARYEWTHINGTMSLSEKKMKVQNTGKAQLLNLVKIHSKNLARRFKIKFSTLLFVTSHEADDNMSSLYDICATYNNTIGGLDGSTVTTFDWNPAIISLTSASPTWANIVDPMNAYYIERVLRKIVGTLTLGNEKPTLILTTQVIWDAYEQVLRDDKRFEGNYRADGGFDILTFRGIDIAVDDNVPDGYMYVLNEKYIGYYHHNDFRFVGSKWKRAELHHVYYSELNWWGGFGVSRRDKQGAVVGLPSDYDDLTLTTS
jgi:hypothetical protein